MRSFRIEPDSRPIILLSLALVAVLAAASFTLSFLGLIQAAKWAGVPEALRWLVPIVVDSTILVYAVAASVQRARGESTRISWIAVGFFTLVSVAANAAHVLAPGGVLATADVTVVFGALLAAIMPISLFFATETTVQLAVAPPYGSVAQRRKRARLMVHMDQAGGPDGPLHGPLVDHPGGPRKGPVGTAKKSTPNIDRLRVRELASAGVSQRAIAEQLGISKTSVARVLATPDLEPVAAG
ncbi:DUF2637 domain-containing protein [Arthrobacter sp. A2-55]|uniref:DUF2637 domain-containing protein n=1 Tax=Arthrobacter sp. A2-55 TaxID=2897337 RepID=UPI0021CD265A|nr:DUF2637 domain-containing protein [Arthrobacter sp. A2-55]MCU6479096.1 DUF2637 domain-containing protein [Arthrobacter sp. A2-55]